MIRRHPEQEVVKEARAREEVVAAVTEVLQAADGWVYAACGSVVVVWKVDSEVGQVKKVAYEKDAAVQRVDKENAEAEDVDMAWVAYLAAVQILEEVPLLRVRILPLADAAHACASTAHRLLLFPFDIELQVQHVWPEASPAPFHLPPSKAQTTPPFPMYVELQLQHSRCPSKSWASCQKSWSS